MQTQRTYAESKRIGIVLHFIAIFLIFIAYATIFLQIRLQFIRESNSEVEEEWVLNLLPGVKAENALSNPHALDPHIEDVTIACTVDTFDRLLSGKLSPEFAFLRGLLNIKGNMTTALKLKFILTKIKSLLQ